VTTPGSDILRADQLSLSYGAQQVVRDVSIAFTAPQTVAVTGPSGSGKTSLLHCLSGLDRRATGSVSLLGHELGTLGPDELAQLRLSHVGFVFQSADLVPELTLRQNIALPLQLARAPRRHVAERVAELVEGLGLAESADRRPGQVSGGQAQRCAVARAVVARPRVVFADEPTGALDQANRDVVLEMLISQVRAIDGLLVTVTHDPEVADRFERRVGLSDGRVIGDDTEADHADVV